MKIKAKAEIQIAKPINEVYLSIILPEQISNYFTKNSSGVLEQFSTITWNLPESNQPIEVTGILTKEYEYIAFDWSGGEDGMMVEIYLEKINSYSTLVKVIEQEFNDDKKGINQAIKQTAFWANFLASLKAYLEFGINIRKDAFLFKKS